MSKLRPCTSQPNGKNPAVASAFASECEELRGFDRELKKWPVRYKPIMAQDFHEGCRSSLITLLEATAKSYSSLWESSPALNRLLDMMRDIKTDQTVLPAPAPCRIKPSQMLDLLAASRSALSVLTADDSAGLGCMESYGNLSQVLDALLEDVAQTVRREKAHRVRGLYVIIDPEVANGRDPLELAASAIRGGARMLQLRDKLRDKGAVLPLAMGMQRLCRDNGVDLIVNDHADVAFATGCAGLHVGQSDLPVAQARRVLSHEQVLGRSNHEIDELFRSQEMGADHLAFGPIYATGTKEVGRAEQGAARLRDARNATQLPLVAIGGITAENVAQVVEAGADAVCVTAAVGLAREPEAAASRLVKAIEVAGGQA